MREIKFRAWDFEEKQFYYFGMTDILHRVNLREVLPEATNNPSIQEWSGLHDKNGKEIYEGDIVTGWLEDGVVKQPVIFSDSCFCIRAKEIDPSFEPCLCLVNDIEVIGNIHENPELLKVING